MNQSTIAIQGNTLAEAPLIGAPASLTPGVVFTLAALASSGTSLLITGIYFFMAHRYGWTLRQNFFLAASQGCVYIIGALNSHRITSRFKPRRVLAIVYALMTAIALSALLCGAWPAIVTALLLLYSMVSVISWPILESQITTGTDSHLMSRRISAYNLVWAATGVVMLAIDGAIIDHWPAGIFLWPATVHVTTMLIVLFLANDSGAPDDYSPSLGIPGEGWGGGGAEDSAQIHQAPSLATPTLTQTPHPAAEPELERVRTLALWLSRLALPATYVVIFGLMALMPSLPIMQKLTTTRQTILGSVWMASRWFAFLALGLTTWWHTRPRLLLAAALVTLVAFIGVTVRPSDVLGHGSELIDLCSMCLWQVMLGICMGIIYSCSLYFGMVLSEGSTEHGGYHEALIGLGQVLGPGAGALAQSMRPGNVNAGIMAVGSVIAVSAIAVIAASIIGSRRSRKC